MIKCKECRFHKEVNDHKFICTIANEVSKKVHIDNNGIYRVNGKYPCIVSEKATDKKEQKYMTCDSCIYYIYIGNRLSIDEFVCSIKHDLYTRNHASNCKHMKIELSDIRLKK